MAKHLREEQEELRGSMHRKPRSRGTGVPITTVTKVMKSNVYTQFTNHRSVAGGVDKTPLGR